MSSARSAFVYLFKNLSLACLCYFRMDAPVEIGGRRARRRPRHRRHPRRQRTLLPIPEDELVDVPVEHEEQPTSPVAQPSSPQSTPVIRQPPTFDYGITLADPAATWALFQTLIAHQQILAALSERAGLPRPSDQPYRLGPDPGPSRPPWSFFPAAGPSAGYSAGPSTGPTAAATSPEPAISAGTSSSTDPVLLEQLYAMLDVSSPSPSSVLDRIAEAEFDPDSDDLLDDF